MSVARLSLAPNPLASGEASYVRQATPPTCGDFTFRELTEFHGLMKLLYVHERFGALAGAEANAFINAEQLGQRGHDIAILNGPSTGKNEEGWRQVFTTQFPLEGDTAARTRAAAAGRLPVLAVL